MIKVDYYSSGAVPSGKANGVHIAKMGSALIESGIDYKLFCTRKGIVDIQTSVSEYYGLKNEIDSKLAYISESNLKLIFNVFRSKIRCCDFVFTRSAKYAYLATKLGIKTVYEIHAPLLPNSNDDKLMRKIVASRFLAGIIVITDSLKGKILKDYDELSKDKIHTFADGSDISELKEPLIQSTKSLIISSGYEFNVGYTGTAGKGRGLDLIYNIALALPKIGFHIVGMNETGFYQFVDAPTEKRPANLIFHGFKSSNSIPYYINSFDLLLAPYQNSVLITNKIGETKGTDTGQWMSPIKIFEYMASGVPFIASDLIVLREVLNDSNCTLVSPIDSQEWINAITRFADEPESFNQKAAIARQELEEKYTWEMRAKGIKETILSCK
ncbi:glycosyltransferase [Vibrio vulnificus]|nr:glycosyltransferase [Vibrio vulnificus]